MFEVDDVDGSHGGPLEPEQVVSLSYRQRNVQRARVARVVQQFPCVFACSSRAPPAMKDSKTKGQPELCGLVDCAHR